MILIFISIYRSIYQSTDLASRLGSVFIVPISAPATAHPAESSIPMVSPKVPMTTMLQRKKAKQTMGAATQKVIICFLKLSPKSQTSTMNSPRAAAAINHPSEKAMAFLMKKPMLVPVSEFLAGLASEIQTISMAMRLMSWQQMETLTQASLAVVQQKAQTPHDRLMAVMQAQTSGVQVSWMAAQTMMKMKRTNMTIQILKKKSGGIVGRQNLLETSRTLSLTIWVLMMGTRRVREHKTLAHSSV